MCARWQPRSVARRPGARLARGPGAPYVASCMDFVFMLTRSDQTVPDCLEVTAKTWDEEIMAVRHRTLPVEGVQFHPESFLTTVGKDLLANFLAKGGRP